MLNSILLHIILSWFFKNKVTWKAKLQMLLILVYMAWIKFLYNNLLDYIYKHNFFIQMFVSLFVLFDLNVITLQ